jgi:hypothetical protein
VLKRPDPSLEAGFFKDLKDFLPDAALLRRGITQLSLALDRSF